MFCHAGRLAQLLRPSDYSDPAFFKQEQERIFKRHWHLVGLPERLARPGDCIAREICGVPVVVRNVDGEVRALRDAPEQPPQRYPVERQPFGVFVNLSADAPGLLSPLGELAGELQRFYADHRVVWHRVSEHRANWKVIAEIAVESYHVPMVHPGTFTDYRPSEHHDHRLEPGYTSYLDTAPYDRSFRGVVGRGLLRMIPQVRLERSRHVHLFPAHLFHYQELISVFFTLEPLAPDRTCCTSTGFMPRALRLPLVSRPVQRLFQVAADLIDRKIMSEDMRMWPQVHQGLRHSPFRGVLSCREERVQALQRYVLEALALPAAADGEDSPGRPAPKAPGGPRQGLVD